VDEDLFARAIAVLAGSISAASRIEKTNAKHDDEAQFAMGYA
jgi:hypothetical protein